MCLTAPECKALLESNHHGSLVESDLMKPTVWVGLLHQERLKVTSQVLKEVTSDHHHLEDASIQASTWILFIGTPWPIPTFQDLILTNQLMPGQTGLVYGHFVLFILSWM